MKNVRRAPSRKNPVAAVVTLAWVLVIVGLVAYGLSRLLGR